MASEAVQDLLKLLGMTEEQLADDVERTKAYENVLANIHEVDPHLLVRVSKEVSTAASDVACDGDMTEAHLRGTLSSIVFFMAMLIKRVMLDNPDGLIISPGSETRH